MSEKARTIKKWEILGAIFSIVVGTVFHFIFEWSGRNSLVAIFGAVNESTWEHLKMSFWPTLFFAAIEYIAWGKNIRNFFFASFLKLLLTPLIIIFLFYGWSIFLPNNVIWSISIFILAIIVGYITSFKVIKYKTNPRDERIWKVLLILMVLKFSIFTYLPPKNFIFKDPINGGYGINKNIL